MKTFRLSSVRIETSIIFILLFAFVSPCLAELTKNDIRQVIREEIKPLETRMGALEKQVATIEGKMATKDNLLSMWKDITGKMETIYGLLIGVLLAIIVSVILPPIFQKWFEQRKGNQYSKEIEELKQEIAALKGTLRSP